MVVNRFNRLFDETHRQGRTGIKDRGIFGLDTFDAIRQSGDYLITWEKGYARDGWDETRLTISFQQIRERNRMGDVLAWDFRCQESPWRRDGAMRQVVVRVRPPTQDAFESEVSILCDNPLYRNFIQTGGHVIKKETKSLFTSIEYRNP